MKCYNCNTIVEDKKTCPTCKEKLDTSIYDIKSTQDILKKIKEPADFAKFFNMFYFNSSVILFITFVALAIAIYSIFVLDNTWAYFVCAIIVIVGFNYFLEMKKIELYYKEFTEHGGKYYILWPVKVDKNIAYMDASQDIYTKAVLKKRINAFDHVDKNELVELNTNKIISAQRPKLFMTKAKFSEMFGDKVHNVILSDNFDDESFIGVQGTIHGFLVLQNGVITIFKIPAITDEFLKNNDVLTTKIPNNNEVKNKNKKK